MRRFPPPAAARHAACRHRRRTRRGTGRRARSRDGVEPSTAAARTVGVTSGISRSSMRRRGHACGICTRWRSSSRPSMRRSKSSAPAASYRRNCGSPVWNTHQEPAIVEGQRQRTVERHVQLGIAFVACRAEASDAAHRLAVDVVLGDEAAAIRLADEDALSREVKRPHAVQGQAVEGHARQGARRQLEAADALPVRVEHLDALLLPRRVGDREGAVGRRGEGGRRQQAPGLAADGDERDGTRAAGVDARDGMVPAIEDVGGAGTGGLKDERRPEASRPGAPEWRPRRGASRAHAPRARDGEDREDERDSELPGRALSTSRSCGSRPGHRTTAAGSLPREPARRRPACRGRRRAAPARRGARTTPRRYVRRARRRIRTSAGPRARRRRGWSRCTRWLIVSQSNGMSERRSMTRTLMSSLSACCAASSVRWTSAPQVITVTSRPSRRTAARANGIV